MAAHPHAMALWFIHPPERDQGVARGSGDPPYWTPGLDYLPRASRGVSTRHARVCVRHKTSTLEGGVDGRARRGLADDD